MLTLAAIGLVVLARRDRRGLVLLAGAVAPYAIFHLVWQENVTTRYALPIVPAIALLAAVGLGALGRGVIGRWVLRLGTAATVATAVTIGLPSLFAYTGEPAPAFRLFRDMRQAGPAPGDVVVAMHRRASADTRAYPRLDRSGRVPLAAARRAGRARVAAAGPLLA